jgi:hypothetical protein
MKPQKMINNISPIPRWSAVATAIVSCVSAYSATYVVTPLGGSFSSNAAFGISHNGDVVGVSTGQPFVFRPSTPGGTTGTFYLLPPLVAGEPGRAYGVNSAGYVVGYTGNANGTAQPALWGPSNQLLGILPLSEVPGGIARSINESGQITGSHGLSINNITTGLWNTSMSGGSYGKPDGAGWSWGIRINSSGQMLVGVAHDSSENAYVVTNGIYTQIPIPQGASQTFGQGFNDFGHAVGNAPGAGAFYYDGFTSYRLQNVPGFIMVTVANGINNLGLIVGEGQRSAGTFRGVVWESPTSPGRDLTELIDPSSPGYISSTDPGWTIVNAYAINDRGQIAAVARRTLSGGGGANTPVLLTPVVTTATVYPGSFTIESGSLLSGGLSSLLASDDDWLTMLTTHFATPITVTFDAVSPSATASSMTFKLETHVTAASAQQSVELFDFNANEWVLLDSRATTTSDQTVTVSPSSPSRFVQPGTKTVRARIKWQSSARTQRSWQAKVDLASWTITP